MADITTRETSGGGATVKGSPLTNAEVDTNFINLNTDKVEVSGAIIFEAKAGEALSKGDVVYVSGVSGNQPVVSKADANDASKMPAYGLAEADATLNAAVNVVTFGTLYDLNTSSFAAGDTVYVSTTAGAITTTAPTGESSLLQNIGTVIRSHASAGSIKVGGAGRTNATPNLNDGNVFIGNASNQAEARALTGDDISGGTITNFASTGIDDNATSTAITIDSSENVRIAGSLDLIGGRLDLSDDEDPSLPASIQNTGTFGNQTSFASALSSSGQIQYSAADHLIADNSIVSSGYPSAWLRVNNGLTFGFGSSTALTINSSENVGIGTTSPDALLHIGSQGVSGVPQARLILSHGGETNNGIYIADTSSTLTTTAGQLEFGKSNGQVFGGLYNVDNSTALNLTTRFGTGYLTFGVNDNQEAMRIDGNGRVGIGTGVNAILSTLHVEGDASSSVRIKSTGADSFGRLLLQNDAKTYYWEVNGAEADSLRLYDATSAAERMRISSSGDVSVTTGDIKLPIEGQRLIFSTSGSPQNVFRSSDTYGTNSFELDAPNGFTVALDSNANNVGAFSVYDVAAVKNYFYVSPEGNVGIGETNPATKLEVKGNTASGSDSEIVRITSTDTVSRMVLANSVGQAGIDANGNILRFMNGSSNTERMRIDTSGNVGIGETLPKSALHVKTASAKPYVFIEGTGTADAGIRFKYNDGAFEPAIFADSSALRFYDFTAGTERMRLDTSGNLLVGTSTSISNDHKLVVSKDSGSSYIRLQSLSLGANESTDLAVRGVVSGQTRYATIGAFRNSTASTATGYVRLDETDGGADLLWFDNSAVLRTSQAPSHIGTASGTVIGTQTSDERLKDIEPSFDYGLSQVMQLKPIAYTLTDEDQPVRKLGFGAQTTSGVIPEAVYDTGECLDGYDQDPDNEMVQTPKSDETKLAMEYVQLIPVLTKAIQEQQAMIEDLKAEVATLKGA